MFTIKFDFVLLFTIFHVTHCERRIVDGDQVTSEKSYVVYLVKAKQSDRTYDSWLCGGALVTNEFIITSAACVEDVHFMYAIAGYRKYVNDKDLNKDDCTRNMRKKIVFTCIPVSYEFDFNKIEKWAYIDIALVKVESPYDFNDARYQIMCSYAPRVIPINYDYKRQASNVDAIVLGWGHTEYWREHSDHKNYNQEYLRFGATILYDKKKCEQEYKDYPDLMKIIEKYMICSLEPGHLNDHGVPYSINQKQILKMDGCITQKQKLRGTQGILCEGEVEAEHPEQDLMDRLMHAGDTRKHISLKESNNNNTKYEESGTDFVNRTKTVSGTDIVDKADIGNRTDSTSKINSIYKSGFGNVSGYFNRTFTRRNGICQNDHGGPLVTWVGKREVLIGIASVFKITAENKCIGPYLYTSTMCNGAFIGCVIGDRRANTLRGHNESVSTRKALLCDSAPSVKGFDTIESYVSWKDHPDGPADNEKDMLRGRLAPNQKKDRYATNVKEDSDEDIGILLNDRKPEQVLFPKFSPKEEEQETTDRFSLNIGLPPGIRLPPKKKPRLRKRRPPIFMPSPETAPSLSIRSQPEIEPQSIRRPSPEMELRPLVRLPTQIEPSTTIRPSETKPVSTVNPTPIMEQPPMIRHPQEMAPSPILRPSLILRSPPIMRPRPIIRLPQIKRPPPKLEPHPVIRPPPDMEPPQFDEMHDLESEEVNL